MKNIYEKHTLMKNYIKYNEDSEQDYYEKLFVEITHINELEIKFDFIDFSECLLYFYKNEYMFVYRKNTQKNRDYFYIPDSIIRKINTNSYEILLFIEKYFNKKIDINFLIFDYDDERDEINYHFNI